MKKVAFLMALLAVLLSACAPRAIRPTVGQTTEPTAEQTSQPPETTVQTEPIQTESTAGAEISWDSPDHAAFQKALIRIHDELYFPELPDAGRIEVWEPGTIEDEKFAIFDVDGDGQDELLISIANTYAAGMCEVIYGYDAGTDGVQVEAYTYAAVTHYPGLLQVRASHNHGYAGDVMWPYQVSVYDEAEDVYKDAYIVDAWGKTIADYDPLLEMPYPEEIDTEHDGYVYLITENEELKILNRADFEKWEAALLAGKEPLVIPWQKMTAWNIGLENPDNTKIIRWSTDDLLYQTDFELCAGRNGTVQLYGKKTSDSFYGASDAVVQLEDGRVIPISIQDGLLCHWEDSSIFYTEAFNPDSGLILEDINFDGYTDIGLQVQVAAYNMPQVYWYYDPDTASYQVLGSFLNPLTVDPVSERCTEEYHSGPVYYKEIYKAQGRLLELEERWITEYIDGQPTTRKDDHIGE